MNADIREVWTKFRLVVILAIVAVVLSILAVTFLNEGLTATRGAKQLEDFGLAATVTEARVHVIRKRRTSDPSTDTDTRTDSNTRSDSGSSSSSRSESRISPNRRYRVNDVEVAFTDPQGQDRSVNLGSFTVNGNTPSRVGWTTRFEDHDKYVGKEVLYLPERPGQAQMRDQMQATLDHGFEPAPTYIGIGAAVLALLGWAVFARVAIGKLRPWMARRRRLLSGIA